MEKILLLFITIVLSCCNYSREEKENNLFLYEIESINTIINNRWEIFNRAYDKDSSLFCKKNECIMVKSISDRLFEMIDSEEINKNTLDSFKSIIQDYSHIEYLEKNVEIFSSPKNLYHNKQKNLLIVKLIELNIIEDIIETYDRSFFHFSGVRAVVVAEKNPIKLGEEFKSEIYIAGNFNNKEYSILINGDTIEDFRYEIIPLYSEKPEKEGIQHLNGSLIVKRKSRNFVFPFSYDIDVQP